MLNIVAASLSCFFWFLLHTAATNVIMERAKIDSSAKNWNLFSELKGGLLDIRSTVPKEY
jgi:hypothetical protein